MKKKKILLTAISSIAMLLTLGACKSKEEISSQVESTDDSSSPTTSSTTSEQPKSDSTSEEPKEEAATEKSCKDALDIGIKLDNFKTTSEKYCVTGTVTSIIGKSFTIQDSTGGLYVFSEDVAAKNNTEAYSAPDAPTVGKKVKVTGALKNYNGLVEIDNKAKVEVVSDTGDTYTATTYTNASDLTQAKQSTLATIEGLKLTKEITDTDAYKTNGDTQTKLSYSIVTKFGDSDLELRVDKSYANFDAITTKIKGIKKGALLKVENTLIGYYNKVQLSILSVNDFSQSEYIEPATMSIKDGDKDLTQDANKISLEIGGSTYNLASKVSLAAEDATKEVSNTDLLFEVESGEAVTVDNSGVVTAVKAGESKVKVKAACKEDVTASVTFTVTGDSIKDQYQGEWTGLIDGDTTSVEHEIKIEADSIIIDRVEVTNLHFDTAKDCLFTYDSKDFKLVQDQTDTNKLNFVQQLADNSTTTPVKYVLTKYVPITNLPELTDAHWITNVADLTSGTYVIATDYTPKDSTTTTYVMSNSKDANGKDITLSSNVAAKNEVYATTLLASDNSYTIEIVGNNIDNSKTIRLRNSRLDTYVYPDTSKNNLHFNGDTSKTWVASDSNPSDPSNNFIKISFTDGTTTKTLRYNTSSPRFSAYTSATGSENMKLMKVGRIYK